MVQLYTPLTGLSEVSLNLTVSTAYPTAGVIVNLTVSPLSARDGASTLP